MPTLTPDCAITIYYTICCNRSGSPIFYRIISLGKKKVKDMKTKKPKESKLTTDANIPGSSHLGSATKHWDQIYIFTSNMATGNTFKRE